MLEWKKKTAWDVHEIMVCSSNGEIASVLRVSQRQLKVWTGLQAHSQFVTFIQCHVLNPWILVADLVYFIMLPFLQRRRLSSDAKVPARLTQEGQQKH